MDLILVPGVAFTLAGARLGHGMGYYDKYFKSLFETNPIKAVSDIVERGNLEQKIKQNKTILIGLAFKEQIQIDLPLDQHDVLLDDIFTSH